jgi:hypothetical protein
VRRKIPFGTWKRPDNGRLGKSAAGYLVLVGGGQGALNGRNCSGVACIPSRPRNFDRDTIEEWLIASPGTVRIKAG